MIRVEDFANVNAQIRETLELILSGAEQDFCRWFGAGPAGNLCKKEQKGMM
jgi:hypothetical protein